MTTKRTVNTEEREQELPDRFYLASRTNELLNDAATRMRDKCVEAGKQCVFAEAVRLGIGAERAIALSSKVMTAIESLTLDQVEKQEQGK